VLSADDTNLLAKILARNPQLLETYYGNEAFIHFVVSLLAINCF
jgi:hypothetical protein